MIQPNETQDVTGATFQERVLTRSATVPVVVDFWAPWCGPCRMISPVLDRLAAAANGAWELVKVNTDEEPDLARRFGIQGIPAIKGFRDGEVVAEFVGVQPEPQIRTWLQLLVPSASDRLARQGREALQQGNEEGAELAFLQALAAQPNHPGALLGLAELALARGRAGEAAQLLEAIPAGTPESTAAEPIRARLGFLQRAEQVLTRDEAERALSQDGDDPAAHWALGIRAAAAGTYEDALEHLLHVVERDRHGPGDQARRAMIDIFTLLGADAPLTRAYRPRLSAALH